MIQEFFKPETIKEAVDFRINNDDSLYIAGGAWINCCDSKLNPMKVIGLEKLGLDKIETNGDEITIGSCVCLQDLIDNDDIPDVIKEAASFQTSRNIRNAGTIGGDIASKNIVSTMTPILIALEADLVIADRNSERIIPAYKYIRNENRNLILKIVIKDKGRKCALKKHSQSARGEILALAAVSYFEKDGKISSPIIAVGAVYKQVKRLIKIEEALEGNVLPVREELEKIVADEVEPEKTYKASEEFRKYITGVCVSSCFYNGRNAV